MFKTYKSDSARRLIFNAYLSISLVSMLPPIFAILAGNNLLDFSDYIAGEAYIVLSAILSINNRFRKSQFALIYCVFLLLYLIIPASFMLTMGRGYVFGEGISIPITQDVYFENLHYYFMVCGVFSVAAWLGVILGPRTKDSNFYRSPYIQNINIQLLIILGVVVVLVTFYDNLEFRSVFLGNEKQESILAFLFSDRAYLLLAGVVITSHINKAQGGDDTTTKAASLVFILYVALFSVAGSKGGILIVLTLFVLYPIYCSTQGKSEKVMALLPSIFVIFTFVSLPVYYVTSIYRELTSLGHVITFENIYNSMFTVDYGLIFTDVLYRLSAGGFDRLVIIIQSYYLSDGIQNSSEYVYYIIKNIVNMLLPGTPFQEAYAPSSNLFTQFVAGDVVGFDGDSTALQISLNTQAYTVFGVFAIASGIFAPFVVFLFVYVLSSIYAKTNSSFLRLVLMLFFGSALSSYGFDIVVGVTFHLAISMLFMMMLLYYISRLTRKRHLPMGV